MALLEKGRRFSFTRMSSETCRFFMNVTEADALVQRARQNGVFLANPNKKTGRSHAAGQRVGAAQFVGNIGADVFGPLSDSAILCSVTPTAFVGIFLQDSYDFFDPEDALLLAFAKPTTLASGDLRIWWPTIPPLPGTCMSSMWTVKLRQSGGSIVMSVPKQVLRMLDLSVGSEVMINVFNGELVVSKCRGVESTLKETPELMALLAKVHATTSRTSRAVTRTLKKMADDDRKAASKRKSIAAQARKELGEDGARMFLAMGDPGIAKNPG